MSENYIVIDGKRAELTKEQMEHLGIEVKENKRWRAKTYEIYWRVDSHNNVEPSWDANSRQDDFRYYSHNYFCTQKEAETYARVLETEMLLKKYADEHNKEFSESKWHLVYDDCFVDGQKIESIRYIDAKTTMILPRTICFSSYEIALFAVNEIGKDRIVEYLTYEW